MPDQPTQGETVQSPYFVLGRADWIYDEDLRVHIPCCTRRQAGHACGNGPLVGVAIGAGDCGEHDRQGAPTCRLGDGLVADELEVCECSHTIATYAARDGSVRCWCCFGKVKNGGSSS